MGTDGLPHTQQPEEGSRVFTPLMVMGSGTEAPNSEPCPGAPVSSPVCGRNEVKSRQAVRAASGPLGGVCSACLMRARALQAGAGRGHAMCQLEQRQRQVCARVHVSTRV